MIEGLLKSLLPQILGDINVDELKSTGIDLAKKVVTFDARLSAVEKNLEFIRLVLTQVLADHPAVANILEMELQNNVGRNEQNGSDGAIQQLGNAINY